MNIGERIKSRRLELGLSVDDVAEALNKNRATVYRYESNAIENLPITTLEPLARVLKTTPPYLMGWTDDPYDWDRDPLGRSASIPPHLIEQYQGNIQQAWNAVQNEDSKKRQKNSPTNEDDDEVYILLERARNEIPDKDRERMIRMLKAFLDDPDPDTFETKKHD